MAESMHEFVIRELQATKGEWPVVAEESGVPLRTLEKIARREVKDPGVSRIEILAGYFRARQQRQPPSSSALTV